MPATDQRARGAEDSLLDAGYPGVDPGEPEDWEIVRVHCPSCDRPIALIGDEERLPQHAAVPRPFHPFSTTVCPGSGSATDDLTECDEAVGPDCPSVLLSLPSALDWRTQPFSHAK
ncbi:hypothetical protein CFP65_0666 [Kitasatospora sp. MMS16-BH015]|uniref:hypothetical protein n=1 Tax=Kitasatospora sp. MMS16-BH015 TaxID=2018025 RepID=UPI000CA1E9D2|nr:hypothetical protein [Kitasatospora sp. MMS16-BH015]AUG75620.1 hypothetical protein CFP65_0666 [Kitasatospora sp. MMS16-BH015]